MSATRLLCKADLPVEIDTLLFHDQPGGLGRDTRTGHHHWCNEACISADWALHVALLLDGGSLGTLPQRWVIQFLLFLRHPQRIATSARRAASQLTPCLDVHKPQQPFEPNLAFFSMAKGKYLAV